MDTLLVDFQDFSAVPLRPWVATLGQPKTYRNLTLGFLTIGSIAASVNPALAVSGDSWDWDSETRQEQTETSGGQARPTMDYKTGRPTRNTQIAAGDRQYESAEQPQEESMPKTQAPDPTAIQVIDDWRATRQSPEERAREQNPGIERDCNGNPYDENEVFPQAELDEDGNVTAEGFKQMGINRNGRSFCVENPGDPNCKLDANGDAG